MAKTQIVMDTKPLKGMLKQLEQFQKVDMNKFMEDCSKALAARLLARVIKRTPVMDGTLRRGWTGGKQSSGGTYAKKLPIHKAGNTYVIFVSNNTKYAPYVEYGHRQTPGRFIPGYWMGNRFVYQYRMYKGGSGMVLKKTWVKGVFMLTIATEEVEALAPALLEKMLLKEIKKVFDGK